MRDHVVIITGASSGIGAELAHQFGREGARLVLAARDAARLKALAQQYPGALAIPTDVTDPQQCRALIEQAIAQFGRIDILIANAGISMWAHFDEITDLSLFQRIMDVNYFGMVYCVHYALPHLKASRGLIVGVSSLTGKTGVPTRTAYSASKHAMQGFLDSLRIELMDTGVDVLVVSPGFVQTEVRERALGADGHPLRHSHIQESGAIPVEACVKQMMDGIRARKRELLIGSARVRIGLWLKLIAPKLVDRMARQAVDSGRT